MGGGSSEQLSDIMWGRVSSSGLILADDDGDDNCIVGTLPGTIAN